MDTTAVWDHFVGMGGKYSTHLLLTILNRLLIEACIILCFFPPTAVSKLLIIAKLLYQQKYGGSLLHICDDKSYEHVQPSQFMK